jgi:probable HAF family extracellular repeat protein
MGHLYAPAAKAALLALSVAVSLLPATQAQTASFTGLGDVPGGDFDSHAYSVSADGSVVVGKGKTVNGDAAFRWTEADGLVSLGDLPGGDVVSRATFTSADGAVVVGESQSARGLEAFRWTEEDGLVGLGVLPGANFFFSRALSVSADGSVVVGESQSPEGFQAFRWEDGVMTGLGDLPGGFFFSQAYTVSTDGTVIAGQSNSSNGPEAFRWTEDGGMVGLGDLPGGTYFSVVYSASADGEVLAGWGQSAEGIEAFRWEDGVMTGLGDLPGSFFFSVALATSLDGSAVVGYSEAEPQGYHAFLWTEADGMRNLNEILEDDYGLDLTGWRLSLAYDISDDGTTIVGYGRNPAGQTEAWRASGLQLGTVSAEGSPEAAALSLTSYPNPARASTRLSFSLPDPGALTLEVYDVLGRRVTTVHRAAGAGAGAVDLPTAGWPAGMYVVRLQAGEHSGRHTFTVVD